MSPKDATSCGRQVTAPYHSRGGEATKRACAAGGRGPCHLRTRGGSDKCERRLRVLVSFPRNNVYFSLMDEAYTDSSAFAGCTALFLLKETYRGNSSRNRINERTPPPPRVCTPGTDSCCRAPRLGAVCRTNAAGHVHVPLAACSHSRPAGWHCARAQAVSSLPSGSGAKESGLEAGHRAEHRGCLALPLPEGTLRPQQPQALAACPHAPLTLAPEDDDKTPNK